MQNRLLSAHASQEDEPMAEVIGLLSNLVDAWYKVADKLAQETNEAERAARGSQESSRYEQAETPVVPYGYDFAAVGAGSEVFTF
jgi:hypothetical protein